MDQETEQQPSQDKGEPTEQPPPFQPDPELIAHFERGGKPSEAEVEEMAKKSQTRSTPA